MSEETVFTLRMEQEKRDEWNDFVDEQDDINSTSQLVRAAVSDYIARSGDDSQIKKEIQEANDDVLIELSRQLELLEQIQSISAEIHNQTNPESLSEIVEQSTLDALEMSTLTEGEGNE